MSCEKKDVLDRNLVIVFGITLMSIMGVSSITPVFPKMMQQLSLTEGQIGLLITCFTVPGVFLTPVLGVAADRYGRKRILFYSLLLFGIAGGLCGFSRNFNTILVLRFFQGVGAASLGSLNTTVIGDLYQDRRRTEAMGYNASLLSIGTAAYPLVGGAMAAFAWHYPFLLPWLAVPLSFLVLKFLDNPEPENTQEMKDYFRGAWKSIRNREVITIFAASIIIFLILYGSYLTYFSILLGQVFEASSITIGIVMFTMSLSTAVTSSQLGRLSKHFGRQKLLISGFLCYVAAFILISVCTKLWVFIFPMIIFGIGQGLNIPMLHTMLADRAPLEYRAMFMSLNGAMMRVGQSLGPLSAGIAYTVWGFNGAFLGGSLLGVLAILIVTYGISASGKQGDGSSASLGS